MSKNLKIINIAQIAIILICSSCITKTERERTEFIPKHYKEIKDLTPLPIDIKLSNRWWKSFNRKDLNVLIEKALTDNFTVQQAFYRLKKMEAGFLQKNANLYPTLNLSSNASRTRIRTRSITAQNDRVYTTAKNFSLGLTTNYEVDLWGKLFATRQAEKRSFIATQYDLEATQLIISAQIAEKYFLLLEQYQLLELQKKQLKTNEFLYKIAEARFKKAQVSRKELLERKQAVNMIQKKLPNYQRILENLYRDIALLLGENSLYKINVKDFVFPILTKKPQLGIPAQLLQQRPDIQAAWEKLQSADFKTVLSKANRLPTLSLAAGVEYKSDKIQFLVNNWIGSIAAGITAPIIDGGVRAAEVKKNEAIANEQMIRYKEVVLNAINEVEASVTNENSQKEYISTLKEQISIAEQILTVTKKNYLKGQNDYIPVLLAISNLGNLNIELIQQRKIAISNRITLFKSLGGAWEKRCNPYLNAPKTGSRFMLDDEL